MNPTAHFLRQLAGEKLVFIRAKDEATGKIKGYAFDPNTYEPEDLALNLRKLSEEGNSVWAMVSASAGKDAPVETNVIWADMDAKNYPGGRTQLLSHVEALVPAPSLTVESGHGLHVYYYLDQPATPAVAEGYAKALQWRLGGDSAWSAGKKMRVPGTVNPKHLGQKGQADGYTEAAECRVTGGTGVKYSLIELPLAPTLEILPHKAMLMVVNGPQNPASEDRSAYDYQCAMKMLEAGLADVQMHTIFAEFGCSGKARSEGSNARNYVTRTISAARTALNRGGGFGAKMAPQKDVSPVLWVRKTYQELLDAPRPGFIVQDFLPHAGLALIAAPPKARKSWAAMQLAHAAATGSSWLGFDIAQKRRVLYVQAELPDHIVAARFEQMYGLSQLDNLEFIRVPAADLTTKEHLDGLIEQVQAFNADLMIVDPVANFWQGDENSASSVNLLFDHLAQIQELGCAVVLVHHTRKTQGFERLTPQHMRGSSVFFARPDAVMTISPTQDGYSWGDFTLRAAAPRDGVQLYVHPNGTFTTEGTPTTVSMSPEAIGKMMLRAAALRESVRKERPDEISPSAPPQLQPEVFQPQARPVSQPAPAARAAPDLQDLPEFLPHSAGRPPRDRNDDVGRAGLGLPELRDDSPAGPSSPVRSVLMTA